MSISPDAIQRQNAIAQLFGANGSQSSTSPFSNLNLTAQQQSQFKSIFQSAASGTVSPAQIHAQIDSVLTSTQQTTLQSDLKSLKSHFGHAKGSPSSSSSLDSDTDAFGVPNTTTTPLQTQNPFSSIAAQFAALQQLLPQQLQQQQLTGL
ncbi:MAG: hypothetical protein ACYDA1_06675 [Vulcanimicrobiaceae bacterium]